MMVTKQSFALLVAYGTAAGIAAIVLLGSASFAQQAASTAARGFHDALSQPANLNLAAQPFGSDADPFFSTASSQADSVRRQIEEALKKKVSLEMADGTLEEALEELGETAGINIAIDAAALEEEGISRDAKVSINLNAVSLRSTLKILLSPFNLTMLIEDEVLKVTNQRRALPATAARIGWRPVVATFTGPKSKDIMKLDDLRIQLKNVKSTEEKDQTKKAVREALVAYFDGDMEQRRAEFDGLRSRSSGMSTALEKRAAVKEQLIDLQLKSFKYEADGLGLFPVKPRDSGSSLVEKMRFGWTTLRRGTTGAGVVKAGTDQFGSGLIRGTDIAEMDAVDPIAAAMNRVNEARKKFRSVKSEEDRTKATTELHKALGQYFDRDMKARQQEIDTINEGLRKMQGGLKKRADAKNDIVDLQLQIIVNEAEGLGFFRTSASTPRQNVGVTWPVPFGPRLEAVRQR